MMALEALRQPFTDPDWVYELKHDGYRCMAGVEADGSVTLRTKTGTDCTAWFPEIAAGLAGLAGGPHIIDGEVCVLRPNGTSDFNLLQERARRRRWYPGAPNVTLCAFDLLMRGGQSVMDAPLMERKAMLEELLRGVPKGGVLFVGELPAERRVFQALVGADLEIEGVVAKRKASTYQPGVRSPDWRKIKRAGWQEGRLWRG